MKRFSSLGLALALSTVVSSGQLGAACSPALLARLNVTDIKEDPELLIHQGPHWRAYLKRTRYKMGALTVEKTGVDVRLTYAPALKPDPAVLETWREVIRENVEFAVKHYDRRHWPESFHEELRQAAQDAWMHSTYVTVRNAGGEIVGTLRFISNRNEEAKDRNQEARKKPGVWTREIIRPAIQRLFSWFVLPVEKALGINLERPVLEQHGHPLGVHPSAGTMHLGEVIEPGNFAIDRRVNPATYRAITLELLQAVFDESNTADFNMHGKILYSYADERGKGLYLPMGFELVDENDPITHVGIPWWAIRLVPKRLRVWIDTLAARSRFTQADADALHEAMTVFSRPEELIAEVRNPRPGQGHGIRDAVGYTKHETVKNDLSDAVKDQLSSFHTEWHQLLSEIPVDKRPPPEKVKEFLTPYETLLTFLIQEELKGEAAMAENRYFGARFTILNGDGNVPEQVFPTDVWASAEHIWVDQDGREHPFSPTGAFSMATGAPTRFIGEEWMPAPTRGLVPHPYVTPTMMEKLDGPLWEVGYWARQRVLGLGIEPETLVGRVRYAIIQELRDRLQERALELPPREMNRRLLRKAYHAVGIY